MKALGLLAAALGIAVAVILAVFTFGMRTKSPEVLGAIRRMNRAYINPRQRDAGSRGSSASLVRHVGRTSGATYQTPVVAEAVDDGFVIALPYGSQSDWLKNVLAAGEATVVHEGEEHRVTAPEVRSIADADRHFSASDRWAHRIFGVTECLHLERATDAPNHP